MAEYLKITNADRWEKMNARSDAAFGKVMAKLEILLQHYNCSPISSHGAANSSNDIPTSKPLNVNLPIQDEIRSSAKQIEVAAKLISESSPSLELYFDNLATDSTKRVEDLGESALDDNVQRIGEFQRGDGFDSQLTVNTMGDCYSGVIATPEFPNAEPITTHSFHNEDISRLDEPQSKATNDDIARNRGLTFQCEIPSALPLTSIVNNHASSMEPQFQLHWDDLFTKHKLVLVSKYGNLAVDITGIKYDSRLIPPDKFIERLLDRAHPYVHMILVGGITQDLHCWKSQTQFYEQSGLLNFAHHMFAEMCEQGVLSWTDLILGSVARTNGWNRQVQSNLTSLPSFTGWYLTSLQENRLIKVQCYSPKDNFIREKCFGVAMLISLHMVIDDDVNVLLVSLGSSDFNFFNENVHIGSWHATKQHITMNFSVLEGVMGMILYPRYSSHIPTLAYGYAMIPFNNHMEVFDTTTYFTHIEHHSTNSLTKGVSSASVIELVINSAFSSLMSKTFSSINKQLEIFILGDDKSKKIWDLTGQSIQCGVRMCKCFIEFPSERFLSAALSFQNCVFVSFNHLVGSYIMEPNLEDLDFLNYSLDYFQALLFGNNSVCEVLEELLYLSEKLLAWVSFAIGFARSFIASLSSFNQPNHSLNILYQMVKVVYFEAVVYVMTLTMVDSLDKLVIIRPWNFGLLGQLHPDLTISAVSLMLKNSPIILTCMPATSVKHAAFLASNGTNVLVFILNLYMLSMSNNIHTVINFTPLFIITVVPTLIKIKSQHLHSKCDASATIDQDECEKATWLNVGISSKLIVNIAFDLEDKKWDPGGCSLVHLVHKEDMLNLELL